MKTTYLYGLLAAAIGLVSCSTEEFSNDNLSTETVKIARVAQNGFQPDSPSRASYEGYSTHFEEGDQLGLILLDGESKQIANAPFTYRGGVWANDSQLAYSSKTARVLAYYPYRADLANSVNSLSALKEQVEIQPNQSSLDDFKRMDLLVCEIDQPAVALNIVFSHAFSMINLSAKSTVTVCDETFGYSEEMADVALAIGEQNYTCCNINGTYACLIKDGSSLETNKFRYFYTISGQASAKTLQTNLTTAAGTQYTFPCAGSDSSATAAVAVGDFYCVSDASGKVVVIPGSAAALPAGLTCSGVVFHTMNAAAFSTFAANNGLESATLPGQGEMHGLIVSTKKGLNFGSAGAAPFPALNEVFQSAVPDFQNLDVSNGYKMTQVLQTAITAGTTTITFSALNNHKTIPTTNATSWYAPSFNELKLLVRGNDITTVSTSGLVQINKQLAKLSGADQIAGNLPSITINDDAVAGGLCLMQEGVEMGWHGVPDEAFYVICAF